MFTNIPTSIPGSVIDPAAYCIIVDGASAAELIARPDVVSKIQGYIAGACALAGVAGYVELDSQAVRVVDAFCLGIDIGNLLYRGGTWAVDTTTDAVSDSVSQVQWSLRGLHRAVNCWVDPRC